MQSIQNEAPESCFSLSFKLIYSSPGNPGTDSVFYTGHDLTDDFNTIFDLLRYDGLFISHNCILIVDLHESKCTVCIEDFDLSTDHRDSEETRKYLFHAIDNLLTKAGLYDHFYMCSHASSPNVMNKTTFSISYPPNKLKEAHKVSNNQMEISKLGFPEDSVPEDYICKISSEIIDIPYFDKRQDESMRFEYRVFMRHIRKQRTNPYTKLCIYNNICDYDYLLWDRIQNFMEKVRHAHSLQQGYKKFLKYICDENISSCEFRFIMNQTGRGTKHLSANLLFETGTSHLLKKRIINSLYYFNLLLSGQCIDQTIHPNLLLRTKFYCALLNFKTKKTTLALLLFNEIKNLKPTEYHDVAALTLTEAANYYLNTEEYELAKEYATSAKYYFSQNTNSISYLDLDSGLKKCEQVLLLQSFKCHNTFNGHSTALRRAATYKDPMQLIKCIEMLNADADTKDNNPKGGFTAMHHAIKNNRLINAWLLELQGCTLNIRSNTLTNEDGNHESGLSCKELIEKSNNENFKSLLLPYIRIALDSTNEANKVDQNILTKFKLKIKSQCGLSNDNDIIYIPFRNIFIITRFYLPRKAQRYFCNFMCFQLTQIPLLSEIISMKSLDNLSNQICTYSYQLLKFRIKINNAEINRYEFNRIAQQQINQTVSRHPNQFLREATSRSSTPTEFVENINRSILKALSDIGFEFKTEIKVAHLYNEQTIEISIDCKCSAYLCKFLQFHINNILNTSINHDFYCESVMTIEDGAPAESESIAKILNK